MLLAKERHWQAAAARQFRAEGVPAANLLGDTPRHGLGYDCLKAEREIVAATGPR
jgi:hypothetical protein